MLEGGFRTGGAVGVSGSGTETEGPALDGRGGGGGGGLPGVEGGGLLGDEADCKRGGMIGGTLGGGKEVLGDAAMDGGRGGIAGTRRGGIAGAG